jgi:hypothetical protein
MTPLGRRHVRLVLRVAQVATAAWMAWLVHGLLFAEPAAADNCSVFTDCFGQANSAAETGFGLALLTGLSLALDFVPVVGDVKGVVEAVTGRDLLTGEELEPWERALGLIPLVPGTRLLGLTDEVVDLGRHGDDLADVGRQADDAGDLGRHADDVGPVGPVRDGPGAPPANRRPSAGDTYPLDPSVRGLVDEYGQATTTPSRRGRISEALGESGGQSYLRDVTGNPDLPMFRPRTDADVADLVRSFDEGVAWPHSVAFNGPHATNIVYFDGDTLHVIEAKGGDSAYAVRRPTEPDVPGLSQTDPNYPRVVGSEMARSTRTDGRNAIGDLIEDAYDQRRVRYVGVRTGPASALRSGDVVTTVDRVFLEGPAPG